MLLLRHLGAMLAGLGRYTVRSGRWWVPVLAAVWIAAAVLVVISKAVVPTAVYALF
jgi:hypothetical protein